MKSTTNCETCQGAGTIPTYRSRWIGGGKTGYRSEGVYDVRCDDCDGTGSVVTAPARNPALERAHREGLAIIATRLPGAFMVSSAGSPFTYYRTTRLSCTCKAGQHGRPCKHRALAVETMATGA